MEPEQPKQRIEWAAGGIVWRKEQRVQKIAVVHRKKHNDWTLPKGRSNESEHLHSAAQREVQEETGYKATTTGLAGCYVYEKDKGTLKIVLVWHMKHLAERYGDVLPDEIDEVAWLLPAEAVARLSHEPERSFVALHCLGRGLVSRNRKRRGKPELDRLAAAINTVREQLSGYIASSTETDKWWAVCAQGSLAFAEAACQQSDLDVGWGALHDAERFMVFGMSNERLLSKATTLQNETKQKLSGWRAGATESLFAPSGLEEAFKDPSKLPPEKKVLLQEVVVEALSVLHGHSDNIYHRMHQVGQQLRYLVTACIVLLTTVLIFSLLYAPDTDFSFGNVFPVALAGALGGVVSAMFQLSRVGQEKIPDALLHGLITFGRPFVGAASALFIYVVLKSNIISLIESTEVTLAVALVLGFVAGFSEHYVLATVAKVSGNGNQSEEGRDAEKKEQGA